MRNHNSIVDFDELTQILGRIQAMGILTIGHLLFLDIRRTNPILLHILSFIVLHLRARILLHHPQELVPHRRLSRLLLAILLPLLIPHRQVHLLSPQLVLRNSSMIFWAIKLVR